MTNAADRQTGGVNSDAIPDVTATPLKDMLGSGSVLDNAVVRLVQEVRSHGPIVTAFGNFVPHPPDNLAA